MIPLVVLAVGEHNAPACCECFLARILVAGFNLRA
jgi:hypothetical protein